MRLATCGVRCTAGKHRPCEILPKRRPGTISQDRAQRARRAWRKARNLRRNGAKICGFQSAELLRKTQRDLAYRQAGLRETILPVCELLTTYFEINVFDQPVQLFMPLAASRMPQAAGRELMTQLIIASEIGYINHSESEMLVDECDKISSMLTKLIQARST